MSRRDSDYVWPMYFAKLALNSPRYKLMKGDPFPMQDKFFLRGLGPSYGVPAAVADHCAITELPYVQVLYVESESQARMIIERGYAYQDAKELVRHTRHGEAA